MDNRYDFSEIARILKKNDIGGRAIINRCNDFRCLGVCDFYGSIIMEMRIGNGLEIADSIITDSRMLNAITDDNTIIINSHLEYCEISGMAIGCHLQSCNLMDSITIECDYTDTRIGLLWIATATPIDF